MQSNNKKICAVIVTFNIEPEILSQQLEQLNPQVNHVCIVDNGSTNPLLLETLKELEHSSNTNIIFNSQNLGIAQGLNIGVKYALAHSYDFILTLDHDSLPESSMVEKLIKTYNNLKNEKIAIVSPVITDIAIPKKWIKPKKNKIQKKEIVISSGSLINANVFKDVGFFYEPLFIYYVDNDFCLRCKEQNWTIYETFSTRLIHREGEKEIYRFFGIPIIYRKYSKSAFFYIARNFFYMFRRYKHYPLFCLSLIYRLFKDFFLILLFDKEKKGKLNALKEGLISGVRGEMGPKNNTYHS